MTATTYTTAPVLSRDERAALDEAQAAVGNQVRVVQELSERVRTVDPSLAHALDRAVRDFEGGLVWPHETEALAKEGQEG
jgi:hypothetical protein